MLRVRAPERCRWVCAFLTVLALLAAEGRADPYTYGFRHITENDKRAEFGYDYEVGEEQLFVDVSDYGLDSDGYSQVLFTFRNIGPLASSICDVYFDDGTLLGIARLIDKDDPGGDKGVDFSLGAKPGELPGAGDILPVFQTTAGFSADSDPATTPNGVAPGEWLGVLFTLQEGKDF